MGFPVHRLRRLRSSIALRELVGETKLSVKDFIVPLFAVHGSNVRQPVPALPEVCHFSIDLLVEEAKKIRDLGIPAILLFGIPKQKDPLAHEAYDEDGIVQKAVRELKHKVPDLVVITDSCMSIYTPNGHSGIIENGRLLNDPSLKILGEIVKAQAKAGADIVAPSAMLDGQVAAIRSELDGTGFSDVSIMSYAAKFASTLYDPFFKQGDSPEVDYSIKKTHQMDIGNGNEALREIELDIEEGADIIMVKPGLFYLDIVYRAKKKFGMPVAAYCVSGEYAMMAAAAKMGYLSMDNLILESMISCKRAGADMIITYCAKQALKLM